MFFRHYKRKETIQFVGVFKQTLIIGNFKVKTVLF